jgi:hypothetical protein
MKPLSAGAALLFSTAVLSPAASADEVFLVGGGRIMGEVVAKDADTVVIDVGAGRVTLPARRVVRIASGTSALAAYRDRASRLQPGDLQGWLALGLWARNNDLITLANDAFARAIAIDPGNEMAQRALGNVQFDGQWMTQEQSYRARGYVEYEGQWMTPEQAQVVAGQRMAEAEARRAEREAAAREREAEARAAQAEAEAERAAAEAAAASGGIPYPWVFGPSYGGYGPIYGGDYGGDRVRHRGGSRRGGAVRHDGGKPPRDGSRRTPGDRPRPTSKGIPADRRS